MKRIVFTALLIIAILPALVFAIPSSPPPTYSPGITVRTNSGTSLPATCTTGDIFVDTDADTNGSLYVCVATDTWKLDDDDGGAGGGTMTTVEEGDVQVGGADIVTLDCGTGLDCTETPDTEINIVVDLSETGLGSTHDTSAELDALYEAADAAITKTDEAETITANWDFTANPMADNEVADNITASSYLPLAGGTMTGEVTIDNLGAEFTAGDDHSDCSAFSATGGGIFFDDSEGIFKKCQDNVLTDLDTDTGGATALDDIGNPDANGSISYAGYTDTRVSTTDGWGGIILHSNVANNASPTTLLTLQFDDANDATNNSYFKIIEDADGTPATLFEFKGRSLTLGTNATIDGIATITASTSVSPQSADGATLGTAALEWSDLYLAAGGVIYGENDQSNTLTSSATRWTANLDFEIAGDDLYMGTNTNAFMLIADGTNFNPVAMSGDATITNAGVVTVADDSHAHVYSDIDAFTEANLYTILSDVTMFLEDVVDDTTPQAGGDFGLNGNNLTDATGRDDDDCTGDQGKFWWDSTDNQWEGCNANSGTPLVLGSGGGGDSISIDSVAVVDPDFQDGGDIDFIDTSNVVTANIDNTGVVLTSITIGALLGVDSIDATGAVDMDYGSGDVTDHTFTTDGTGDGEIVLPNDSIGPAEMASGAYDLGTSLEADTLTEGGVGVPNTGDNLSVFAATTSAQLYGVTSDETGSAAGTPLAVFNQNPTIDDITIGSAGVKISDDGDGAITLLGLGDGSDEDLTINLDDTANTVVLSSSTGVTEIDAGSFQMVTTGDIMGGVNISSHTAATYTVGTNDASESYGTLFINGDNDAVDFTLPSAVAGMSACFMQGQGVSGAITVQPNTGDYLVVDGTRGTAATDYASSGAGGDKLCVIAMDATDWIVTTEQGTWSE